MHLSFNAMVHALVDLVDERERRLAQLGERHEVHDRRERALASAWPGITTAQLGAAETRTDAVAIEEKAA